MNGAGRLLLVDDDREIRDLVSRFLTTHGYNITAVRDGREMTSALGTANYDLIVLDLMLPGADGLQLCRELRARSPIPDPHAHRDGRRDRPHRRS